MVIGVTTFKIIIWFHQMKRISADKSQNDVHVTIDRVWRTLDIFAGANDFTRLEVTVNNTESRLIWKARSFNIEIAFTSLRIWSQDNRQIMLLFLVLNKI
jgi:hypothetical protein